MRKIGVVQICSGLEPGPNLEKIKTFIDQAKSQNCDAVFLPEVFYSMSNGTVATPYLVDPVAKNKHYLNLKKLAKDSGVYLLGGSAATLWDGKVINRNYNFDSEGNELTHYDKIHLFACDLSRHSSKTVLNESAIYTSGNRPATLQVGEFKIGLSICFDVRFPEMYRDYSINQGCNLMSVSAAFTVPTGKAHWHSLLRARAIENQSYVVASAQVGKNNEKIQTFGHSLIIDPWGEVLTDAKEEECLITAELDINLVEEVRGRLKVLF